VTLRRGRFGLRPRLLAALVLTAVVTLAVAALALLSPLEHRLRSDGENAVLSAVNVTRGDFLAVRQDRNTDAPNVEELTEASLVLRRRANARVIVLDPQLNILYQTTGPDPDLADNFADVRHALATGRQNHSLQGDNFLVAQPIRIGGRPYALALRRRLQYVSPAVHVVRSAFLKAAGAGLLIALLLGVGLTTTLLRRLERLRDATRELERDGADAEPPLDASRDEIGELTRAFASMHSKLRRQEAARRAFVATASHELRTPLTSLDGMLELLEDDLHADHLDLADARRRTARAREQSRRLAHLASDLLDLSRLDAEVEMRAEPLELGELCRAVVAEFELHAQESRVRLEIDPPPGPCWVLADPGAVARIVRILLDNALRVAPAESCVELAMACGKVWAAVSVRDQGPGVPEAERELIFERFQRGSGTRGEGGFGLGLAIGRELAERMNGSLELDAGPAPTADEPPGAGFTLRLPVAEVAGANGVDE
jgi:signal transduction histidine kinase